MDNAQAVDRLQDLYLTGVRRNGNDIGVGAYGKVFEVECFGTVYAAKEIHSILVQGVRREEFEATKKAFLAECIRSGSLSHPNVVHFLGVYNPGGQSLLPVLVMERMQESLTSVVEKYPNIPMYVKLSILLDVSRGLWYLHGHHPPIVHRDLSPNNVLLTSQFVAKISDLGVAKVIQADSKKTDSCSRNSGLYATRGFTRDPRVWPTTGCVFIWWSNSSCGESRMAHTTTLCDD